MTQNDKDRDWSSQRIAFAVQAMDSAHRAANTFLVKNGGAAVACLAFLAATIPEAEIRPDQIAAAKRGLYFFALGVLLAGTCSILAYVINRLDFENVRIGLQTPKISAIVFWLAFALAFLCLATFVAGALIFAGAF